MSNASLLRRLPPLIATSLAGMILAIAATVAQAATTTLAIGFDTDNNAATGCTLSVGSTSMPGVEVALFTVVTTTGSAGTVGTITRRTCTSGVFGAPVSVSAGGWPVGMTAGLNGSDLIETFIPLADLGGAAAMKIGAITAGDSMLATGVLVLQETPAAVLAPIPALSPPALLILLILVGGTGWLMRRYARRGGQFMLVLCATAIALTTLSALAIVFDGNGNDWTGVAPLATDLKGDAAPGEDLVALYAVKDGANLALRVDMVLARDAVNQAPVVNAGANQTITLPATATLNGSATDDGLPNPPATLTYLWTKFSGPGTVTFGNAASAATSASFSVAGTYVLRLTANDSALSASADVTIIVNPASTAGNQPPVVNAGPNQTITLPAAATLAGTATDDGLPNPPAKLATTWSLVSGPASGVAFGNPASPGTSATFAAPGIYVLRLSANDGALGASSDTQVTVVDGSPLFLTVADRTIELGTRFQQLLVASDGNVGDTLTYSLLTAPAGAVLGPSPLIDWTPTAAQLGSNTFTAKVTNTAGRTATITFRVTVVHTNHAPQLAPQFDVTLSVGTAFSRTLGALDPDAGDTLTFALVSGPAGMTLTGAALSWATTGRAPGDYAVTVKVTDASGLSDSKQFTVTLTPAAPPPVANADSYEARQGATLTVSPAGVLANDVSYSGRPLSAIKLTDPTKGTLNAFNADGGFTYTPGALPPRPTLNPAVAWRTFSPNTTFPVAADFDGDGTVDIVTNDFGNLRAYKGSNGALLWQYDPTITTNADARACSMGAAASMAVGAVTSGTDIYLFVSANCGDNGAVSGADDRYVAINASRISPTGKVAAQWVSPRMSKPHPGAYVHQNDTTLPPVPIYPSSAAVASDTMPTLARLTPGGPPKLLFRFLIQNTYGAYFSGGGAVSQAGCRTATGLPADEHRACKATFIVDAATGAIDQILAPDNPDNERATGNTFPSTQNAPIVADLDGDGQVEIVSGGDVFKLVGGVWTLAWRAQFDSSTTGVQKPFEPNTVAVADLDGDGKADVITWIVNFGGTKSTKVNGIHIFGHDGTFKRKIPLISYYNSFLSVADVDGDGAPEIVFTADSVVYAFRPDGSMLWAKALPDILTGPDIIPTPPLAALNGPLTTDAPVQVYDLDLDGKPEVIVRGTRRVFILDGRTGAERYSIDTETDGIYLMGNPMLVDANNDGHVDILVSGRDRWNCAGGGGPVACIGSLLLISGADHNWAPGPKIHNQMSYRPGAVNGAGQILYDASMRRDFRQQIQQGTVVNPNTAFTDTFTYKANDGSADSAPATVSIFIKPPNSPPVITSTPPTAQLAVAPYPQLVYTITAFDPDPGDTVHFELVSTSHTFVNGVTVNSTTGAVNVYSGPCGSFGGSCNFGLILVVVAAVDSHGARTEQSFFIDSSTAIVTVPNVVGQLLPAARTAIESAGLIALVVTETFGPQPAGTVLGQSPVAGAANIPRSTTVKLTVSKGPTPVAVPFVVGKTLTAANSELAALGFTVNVTTVFSTTIPVKQVMAQAPDAGTKILPVPANPVALTVSAGPPLAGTIAQIVVEPGTTTRLVAEDQVYKATAVFTDGTSADVTLAATWLSTVTSVATVNATGTAHAVGSGATVLRATAGSASGQTTLNVVTRVPSDIVLPSAIITAPATGGAVTGPTPVGGTATDANFLRYELAYAAAGDATWTLIGEGTSPVTNGTLGTFDPTTLLNDLYTVRLTVFDRGGNQTVATTTVQAKGDRKVGLFSLTYQDLNVPAAGIPLTIHRTYDSRDKAQGDFGIGWRLGLQTLRLRTNRVLGTGWVRTVSGPTVSLVPTSEHKVSLTLPDGQVEEFDMRVSPTSNIGSLDFTNVTGFSPRPGTLGQLQSLVNNSLLIVNGGAEDELLDDATLATYSPKLYRYTGVDGTQIEISPVDGVKKVTDRSGNAVTFGPGGILHSDGRGIVFTRDGKGRIVAITDLLGNVQTYAYDGNGDLVKHTSAVGGVSTYGYNLSHGLIDIRDATGNQAVRNEYDASGRLIAMIDAAGKRIEFAHDPVAQQELITDRRGNQTRVIYDGSGNVVSMQQAVTIAGSLVNAVTTAAYDAQGNETSRVDPDGKRSAATFSGKLLLTDVTDPGGLNLTATYAYNARNEVANAADAGGRPYAFTFNANGVLTGATTPLAGASTLQSNAQGLPTKFTDAVGTTTTMTRNAAGRVVREEVAAADATLLRRIDYAYDANGNRKSETLYRTINGVVTPLTTQYGYDAGNRLVTVTDPLGGIARTDYDAVDRVVATTDALGRRTTITYDTLGRRIRTTFADGTFAGVTYDVNGNVATETDAAGRTIAFAYDELNRQVKTTLPAGSFTAVEYSAGGRVMATIDANGNRTDVAYDAAGRSVKTTLPAVISGVGGGLVRPQVVRTLDALGKATLEVDANGRTTAMTYDPSGRLSQMAFADGSNVRYTYDALGRRTSVVNEEGQTTQFTYDGLGRIVAVSGLAGDATYAYDEAGNLVAQTDALGRVTRLSYDALNRLTKRQSPGGETETLAYDAAGNLVAVTDPNGKTTSFTYDAMDRIVRKNLPGGASVVYAYTADGQRSSVTDARGATTYAYDALGQLSGVTHPDGAAIGLNRDANGNLLSLSSPAGTISYVYDALNRLTQVSSPEGQGAYFYDLGGNRVRTSTATGILTDYTFDARNRLTQLAHKTASSTVLRSFANAYSPAGRRTQVTENDGSVEAYTYDAKGRLVSETRTGTNPFTITHAYDAVGNRTQATRNGVPTAFTYDGNDRLVSDGTATNAYDANGNLVTRTSGPTVTQYGYDAENRVVAILGGGLANQYAYDADGNRVLASNALGVTRFLVDGTNPSGLAQVLEERDGGGSLQARYVYGNELQAMARGGNSHFFHRDAHGSTRLLTDGTGTVSDSYTYDAFGGAVAAAGSTINPYRYSGERLDADSGLYQLRARYYSPALGRFVSRDPFRGDVASPRSLHPYLYADADPVNNSDPTGLFATVAEFSVGSYINAIIDAANLTQTIGKACTLYSTTEQVQDLIFASTALAHMVLAAEMWQRKYSQGDLQKASFAGKGDLNLFSVENSKAKNGSLKKLAVSVTGTSGRHGIKASLEAAGNGSIHDGSRTVEFEVTWPPLTVKGAGGGKVKAFEKKFDACGIEGGKITTELNIKAYGGYAAGAGVSSELALKLELFNGRFSGSLPLMGVDFNPWKGMGVTILGVSLGFKL